MNVVRIEFTARRAWRWALLISAVWFAICLLVLDRWADSWTDASVWVALPVVYVGAVVAAANADLARTRQKSGITTLALAGARSRITVSVMHLVSTWGISVLVPVFAVLLLVSVVGWTQGASGTWSWGYLANGVLHATVVLTLGRIIGTWVKSAVFAPVLALVFGLVAGLYLNPVPPSNYPWDMPSPGYTAVLAAAALGLLVAAVMVSVGALAGRVRARSRNVVHVGAAAALVLGIAVAGVVMGLPVKAARTADAQECASTEAGTRVCVWPEHEEFLEPLLIQADRFDEVTSELAWVPQRWSVQEPGLDLSVDGRVSVVVQPTVLGAGLWLTAEAFAFAVTADCPAVAHMSASQISELRILTLASLDVMTGYIYGHTRPSQVRVVGEEIEQLQADDIVAEVAQMSRSEQRQWLVSSFTDRRELCR